MIDRMDVETNILFPPGPRWALSPAYLAAFHDRFPDLTLESLIDADGAAEAAWEPPGYDVAGGVAVVDVAGPVASGRTPWLAAVAGTALSDVAAAIMEAAADPGVAVILLRLNSPGGECAGLPSFGAAIMEARRRMPVAAWATGRLAGAALSMALETGTVWADPRCLIGPLGVARLAVGWWEPWGRLGWLPVGPGDPGETLRTRDYLSDRAAELRPDVDRRTLLALRDWRTVSAEGAEAGGIIDGMIQYGGAMERMRRR